MNGLLVRLAEAMAIEDQSIHDISTAARHCAEQKNRMSVRLVNAQSGFRGAVRSDEFGNMGGTL
jgi:hypothetical protein